MLNEKQKLSSFLKIKKNVLCSPSSGWDHEDVCEDDQRGFEETKRFILSLKKKKHTSTVFINTW